jgi:hypothetical protein
VLTRLPGVGPLTALVILAEIGDIGRFGSARKLAAWAGLTPTVRGSDRTVRHGHIPMQGSTRLRWILCEAAQTAKRSPEFAATYQAITRRRGKNITTTAVARNLLTRAYHSLGDLDNAPTGNSATSAATKKPACPGPARRHRRITTPGRARVWARAGPAALDDLTEQPGPGGHGHGRPRRRSRMGACKTLSEPPRARGHRDPHPQTPITSPAFPAAP